jgi:hypothetical protein
MRTSLAPKQEPAKRLLEQHLHILRLLLLLLLLQLPRRMAHWKLAGALQQWQNNIATYICRLLLLLHLQGEWPAQSRPGHCSNAGFTSTYMLRLLLLLLLLLLLHHLQGKRFTRSWLGHCSNGITSTPLTSSAGC